jgi:hypothetical protein
MLFIVFFHHDRIRGLSDRVIEDVVVQHDMGVVVGKADKAQHRQPQRHR